MSSPPRRVEPLKAKSGSGSPRKMPPPPSRPVAEVISGEGQSSQPSYVVSLSNNLSQHHLRNMQAAATLACGFLRFLLPKASPTAPDQSRSLVGRLLACLHCPRQERVRQERVSRSQPAHRGNQERHCPLRLVLQPGLPRQKRRASPRPLELNPRRPRHRPVCNHPHLGHSRESFPLVPCATRSPRLPLSSRSPLQQQPQVLLLLRSAMRQASILMI